MKQLVLFIFIIAPCFLMQAQTKYRVLSVPAQKYGTTLRMPFTGGMDSPEFSEVDLNGDGIKDLFVFDKVGNKVLTFLSDGVESDTMYTYAPQYESLFPAGLDQWALLIDYNHDAIPDIFTHSSYNNSSGIAVYKGSIQGGYLHYDLVCPLITYIDTPYTPSIKSLPGDIPAIIDVNRDGGVDILSYDQFGTTIAYYQNLNAQNPGNAAFSLDSFKYTLVTTCWGNVAQGQLTNSMTLNQSCKGGPPSGGSADQRHAGNSIYPVIDPVYNDVDLLNGNFGYDNMVLLRNCGDSSYATVCEWDSIYPTCNVPMFIPTYPAAFGVDVNYDGHSDILLAPNYHGSYYVGGGVGRNTKNCMYYKNTNDTSCWYAYQTDSFLVHHALDFGSNSRALFYDYNGDGLLDLIVGNLGYFDNTPYYSSTLAYYQNTGTATHPVYTEVTEDLNNISLYNLVNVNPAFADMNGDGHDDLIIGEQDGYLDYLQNSATTGSNFPSITASQYFNITVGDYPAPFVYDINGDSLNDLVIGDVSGKLTYIPNTGTKTSASFNMTNAISNFGGINVTPAGSNKGYSSPYIRKDSAGNVLLYVGAVDGYVHQYLVNTGNLNSAFTQITPNFIGQGVGSMATISMADINGDGKLEYVVGNARGGLLMYSDSMWDPGTVLGVADIPTPANSLKIFPNPAKDYFVCAAENTDFINPKTEVYNLLGQNVNTEITLVNNKVTVNTASLTNGFYVLRIMDMDKIYTAKVVIQR